MDTKYNVGDKFCIEIDSVIMDNNSEPLYKIKGFNSLVFDDYGLDKLEKINVLRNNYEVNAVYSYLSNTSLHYYYVTKLLNGGLVCTLNSDMSTSCFRANQIPSSHIFVQHCTLSEFIDMYISTNNN